MDSFDPIKLAKPREARQVEAVVPEPDKLAFKELENAHAKATQRFETGWVGVVCGSRGEKAGNMAFLTILICLLTIIGSVVAFGLTEQFFKLLSALVSVITLALGYIFGANSAKS